MTWWQPWRDLSASLAVEHAALTAVEIATAEYVDWYNQARLHGELDHVPPAECEAAYYLQSQPKPLVTATT